MQFKVEALNDAFVTSNHSYVKKTDWRSSRVNNCSSTGSEGLFARTKV